MLCLILLAGLLPTEAFAVTRISSVSVTNLTAPRAGTAPDTSVTLNSNGVQLYSIDWYDRTAKVFLEAGDTFIQGHIYEVQIWVEVRTGYEFSYIDSRTPDVTATVNSKSASVGKAFEYSAWAMVVVSYAFPACPASTINFVAIELPGLTKVGNVLEAPENGYIPFEIKSASEDISLYPELNINRYYPYGFRWNDTTKNMLAYSGDRFKGGRDYYVHLAIQPNSGTFADDLVVTINGKEATIKAKGASYAEVGVEVTCFGGIVASDIMPVVILPKDGGSPDFYPTYASPQCEHIDYATVTGWYDVETGKRLTSDDTFVGGKQYRVEVACTAAYPYRFAKDANNKMAYNPYITGHEVDSYTFGYDDYRGREVIYISKTFTAENRDHTCIPAPWQCDDTGHERFCSICGKALAGGAHWGGNATCANGKVCEVCGYEYTQPHENHTPDTGKWTACGKLYHAHLCKICGAHCTPEDHIPGPEATETTAQTCTVCGFVLVPPKGHTHTPSDWRTTGAYHYKVCTGCGEMLTQEDHKGGSATCKDPALCSVCSYAYLEPHENHTPDTGKWTACGNLYHAHLCKICGAHCTPEDHTPGPEATETTAQTCTECGYILQPAKNHTHQLTHIPYVEATCLTTGTLEHYACSGCSTLFADAECTTPLPDGTNTTIPCLTHETADDWGMDETFHWRRCKLCQTVLDETKMVHEAENDQCRTCGYALGSAVPKPEPTPPAEPTQPSAPTKPTQATNPTQTSTPENEPRQFNWLPILLVALVSIAAVITAVILLKRKQKKSKSNYESIS